MRQLNRKRKHPLEAQLDADWWAGMFVMLTAIIVATLISLPIMSRARFNGSNEPEREPMQTRSDPRETKGKY